MSKNNEKEPELEQPEEQRDHTCAYILVASVVVWVLAVVLQPFGAPLPVWHWINGLVSAGSLVGTIYQETK